MKRALVYVAGAVLLAWVSLAYGPDLLGVEDSAYGDDSGLTRRLDILPWVALLLVGYGAAAAAVEVGIRTHRRRQHPPVAHQ